MSYQDTYDFAKQLVFVGDVVAYVRPNTVHLEIGRVTNITPKGFTVQNANGRKTNRDKSQVIKLGDHLMELK